MARPSMPPGQWGAIKRTEVAPNVWRARARYRDFTGAVRLVEARSKSGAAAETALKKKLHDLRGDGRADGVVAVTSATKMGVAFDQWWRERQVEGSLSLQSFDTYESTLRTHLRPALENLRVREVTPVVVNRLLTGIQMTGRLDAARQARNVLTQVMAMCVRYGATPTNPVRDAAPTRKAHRTREVRTLPLDQVATLREAVRAWEERPAKKGTRNITMLPQIVDTMLGTGVRIGECLALRKDDLDLDCEVPTLTVTGTLVRVSVEPVAEGRKRRRRLIRQAKPKSDSSRRTITLPDFVVVALREALDVELNGGTDRLVFPSTQGTPRSPGRVREQLDDALKDTDVVAKPHDFRRTVATLVADKSETKDATALLGHSTEATTLRHYIKRTHVAPDMRDVLDVLVPVVGGE